MPFNGSGGFTRVMDWTNDRDAAIKIRADRHDQNDDDLANGLSNTICRDGQSQITANIPFNGKKITGLANPTDPQDAATKNYADALRTFASAITLSGNELEGQIKFTGSSTVNARPLGLSFATTGLFFGVKQAAVPAGTLDRWVWNDHVTGGGVDRMLLTTTGLLTLWPASDVSPNRATPTGHLLIQGSGYSGWTTLDANGMHIGNASLVRPIIFELASSTAGALREVARAETIGGGVASRIKVASTLNASWLEVASSGLYINCEWDGAQMRVMNGAQVCGRIAVTPSDISFLFAPLAAAGTVPAFDTKFRMVGDSFEVRNATGSIVIYNQEQTGGGLGRRWMSNGSAITDRSSANTSGLASHHVYYNGNGVVGSIQTTGSATNFVTSSDENLKDFIGPYDPQAAIAIIRADPVRDFNWKSDGRYAVGWGAQTSYGIDRALATPPAEDANGNPIEGDPNAPGYLPWGMDHGKRTPYLWAALTWCLDQIDDLVARVEQLEGSGA